MFLLTIVGIVGHCHSPMRHSDRLPPFRTTSPSASFAAKHIRLREVPPQGPGSEFVLPILLCARNISKSSVLEGQVN